MSVLIRRKKKLFEADEQQQNNNQQNNQQNGQQQNADNNNQNNQQNNQQQEPAQKEPSELQKKVTACINNITEVIKKNDPYTLIALDLPAMIQQSVPEFKGDNAEAKEAIGAWEVFKKGANKDSFDKFMTAFATFGNGGEELPQNGQQNNQQQQNNNQQNNAQNNQNNANNQQQNGNQQQQPAQNGNQQGQQNNNQQQAPANNQQNNNNANVQDVSNSLRVLTNHLKAESLNNKFRDELLENLQASMRKDRYENILKNGWQDPEVIFG